MKHDLVATSNPKEWIVGDATDGWGFHIGKSVLTNVHDADKCLGEHCTVHNPSDHKMRGWMLTWRGDKGVFERRCPHGIGHPDPDDAAFLKSMGRSAWTVHACDSCCN
jgi:hypothetical protein